MAKLKLASPQNYQQDLMHKNAHWTEIISEWYTNAESPSIFCKNKGVDRTQFYYWRKKLSKKVNSKQQQEPNFIEFPILNQTIGNNDMPMSLKIDDKLLLNIILPNRITIAITISIAELGKVIQQVGALKC